MNEKIVPLFRDLWSCEDGSRAILLSGIKIAEKLGMLTGNKKILVIDEYGFSRICSAILSNLGAGVSITTSSDMAPSINARDFDVIVMSYPYCAPVFDKIAWKNTPIVILADNFDENLIRGLSAFDVSYCMIKPLDYEKFKSLVREVIGGDVPVQGGYSIL